MRNLVVIIWCFILGQVVGYIGGALSEGTYDFTLTTIASLVCAVAIILIGYIATPNKKKTSQK